MNKPPLWKIIFFTGMVILANLLIISLAFLMNSYFFKMIDFHPSAYVHLMLTNILGILLFIILTSIFSRSGRTKQINVYLSIIDALKKIAQGNFNVYLDLKKDRNNQFIPIVENINHMAKQLKQMEELRQEFISNVSHEIQSPLTSISGFASALQDEKISKNERKHYLDIIEKESKRLSKLSDNLLKLTSLESDQHPFERKEFRLDNQIRKIILLYEPQWMEKNLDLDVSLNKVAVSADEDLLSQVWNNLIHNSIKFTPSKGKIRIWLEEKVNEVVVKISDTGIGISEEGQIHIFERFYKADKSRNRTKGGNGLGLSIVKKIIEMHNGTISVTSQIGKGTTFLISIPKISFEKES